MEEVLPFWLRPSRRDDIAAMAAVESRIALHPWSQKAFEEEMAGQGQDLLALTLIAPGIAPGLVLEQVPGLASGLASHGVLAGYLMMRRGVDEWSLMVIGVDSPWQRRGWGALMLAMAIRHAAFAGSGGQSPLPILLEVSAANRAALRLYGCWGFFEMGRRRNYYPPTSRPTYAQRHSVPPSLSPSNSHCCSDEGHPKGDLQPGQKGVERGSDSPRDAVVLIRKPRGKDRYFSRTAWHSV